MEKPIHGIAPMKIAIVSTSDIAGGAARAAYRLKLGLQQSGHDASFYTRVKRSRDPDVIPIFVKNRMYYREHPLLVELENEVINVNRPEGMTNYFTIPFEGYDLTQIEGIMNADVINLHWVDNFLSAESIAKLLAAGKRIVWTLHDQSPFTGGCHYSAGCKGYETTCSACPQLSSKVNSITAEVLQDMVSALDDSSLTVVAPSTWMADCAKRSSVFRNQDVCVIPNSLETDVFVPSQTERRAVGILFGAESLKATRKGFALLLDALKSISVHKEIRRMVDERQIELLTFGKAADELESCGIPVRYLGHIKDDRTLAKVYSQATVFVLPSMEDNLPNTILESFACGTPVIAFDTGGIPDLVNDDVGRLIPAFDTDKLGEAILEIALNTELARRLGNRAREVVLSGYKLSDQAAAYEKLFSELAATKGTAIGSQNLPGSTTPSDGKLYISNYFVSMYRIALTRYRELILDESRRRSLFQKMKSIPVLRSAYQMLQLLLRR